MNSTRRIKKKLLIASLILHMRKNNSKKKIKRRWWVRPINQNRSCQGDWENLVQEMRSYDEDMFFNYTRMTVAQFDHLLALVGPMLKKNSIRKPVPEGARLILTLRHLATGDSLSTLAFSYRLGKSTVCNIIKETCEAIWTVLAHDYIKFPTVEEWKNIANEFEHRWNLPHCLGALDGKHVVIKAPNNSGSQYFNYKKTFSIVLFGICDANYLFTYVDIGAYGSQSDGGILRASSFGVALYNDTLDIPEEALLPGTRLEYPYFFVGDEAFPLQKNLLRPYSGKNLACDKQIFNYRLSRARRCIENAFGILVSRFRIFHRTINAYPDNVDNIIKACISLHNFIKLSENHVPGNKKRYCPNSYTDRFTDDDRLIPGEWRNDIPENCALQPVRTLKRRIGARNATNTVAANRDNYKDYVNGIGQVPWQNDTICK